MTFSPASDIESFAAALVRGAALELYLTPKPGLVDLLDSGSHPDLSIDKMERSIGILHDYLLGLCLSLRQKEPLSQQKEIGKRAEARMYREVGANTHKGYIFLSGLLLTARQKVAAGDEESLQREVGRLATEIFALEEPAGSNGSAVRSQYRAGSIVLEARDGLPALFHHGAPTFREVREETGSFLLAGFAALGRLMQVVEDSTTLHRCGIAGLARIRRDGVKLEKKVRVGGNFISYLRELNAQYRQLNLTMGGVADMLALTFGYVEGVDEAAAADAAVPAGSPAAVTTAETGGWPA